MKTEELVNVYSYVCDCGRAVVAVRRDDPCECGRRVLLSRRNSLEDAIENERAEEVGL